MLNSTTWLYGAEVLPMALRSKVMGLAAASHFIVNVASESSSKQCLLQFEDRILLSYSSRLLLMTSFPLF